MEKVYKELPRKFNTINPMAKILKEIWLWTIATLVAIPVALMLSPVAFGLGMYIRLLVDWLG